MSNLDTTKIISSISQFCTTGPVVPVTVFYFTSRLQNLSTKELLQPGESTNLYVTAVFFTFINVFKCFQHLIFVSTCNYFQIGMKLILFCQSHFTTGTLFGPKAIVDWSSHAEKASIVIVVELNQAFVEIEKVQQESEFVIWIGHNLLSVHNINVIVENLIEIRNNRSIISQLLKWSKFRQILSSISMSFL